MNELLRVYLDPSEIVSHGDKVGYPKAWVGRSRPSGWPDDQHCPEERLLPRIPDYVRQLASHRCVRCGHPYPPGITLHFPRGEWTPCDKNCTHKGIVRMRESSGGEWGTYDLSRHGVSAWEAALDVGPDGRRVQRYDIEARWRILTVHHLNGIKHDCRWWNLVSLCQRCHLEIQGKVVMERSWDKEHSEWFKPYAAGYYASSILGEELSREEVISRLDALLALEHRQLSL